MTSAGHCYARLEVDKVRQIYVRRLFRDFIDLIRIPVTITLLHVTLYIQLENLKALNIVVLPL